MDKSKVEFKKGIGPILGDLNLENILKLNESDFVDNLNVYKLVNLIKNNDLTKNKYNRFCGYSLDFFGLYDKSKISLV